VREARHKWQSESIATHYASGRFSSTRARERDMKLIEKLMVQHAPRRIESLLDAPCGTGRLAPPLSARTQRYVGADISRHMLSEFDSQRVAGNAARLPFRSDSFDLVISCRLLHHLDTSEELPQVLAELTRVSAGLVIASFWDSASWPGLRRARGWRRDETGRRAVSRGVIEEAFASCSARVVGYAASCRFVSMQTFVAARKD
jgi:ubiquinone/menaquinone biosynthesis C-methylase UbiE